jgi:5-hydroxyisourate hydrolase
MSTITTHVLDTVLGKPAVGIAIRLERMPGGWVGAGAERAGSVEWVQIATGVTNDDGRSGELKRDAAQGVYRLTFATGDYMKRLGRPTIYTEIAITFDCSGDGHYHLPLLLSDNSYTTYRGS